MAARPDLHADSISLQDAQPNTLPRVDEDLVDLTGPDAEIPETQLSADPPLSNLNDEASTGDIATEIESSASVTKRKRRVEAEGRARKQPRRGTPKSAVIDDGHTSESDLEKIISTLTHEVELLKGQLNKKERALGLRIDRIAALEYQTWDLRKELGEAQEAVEKLEQSLDTATKGNKSREVTILVLAGLLNSGDRGVDPVALAIDD